MVQSRSLEDMHSNLRRNLPRFLNGLVFLVNLKLQSHDQDVINVGD